MTTAGSQRTEQPPRAVLDADPTPTPPPPPARVRAPGRIEPPTIDPAWMVVLDESPGLDRAVLDAHDSLLTVGNGVIGVRGVREDDGEARQLVLAAGVYDERGPNPLLLNGPISCSLVTLSLDGAAERRILDLRAGVLYRHRDADGRAFSTERFVSLRRPGVVAMRAMGPPSLLAAGLTLRLPDGTPKPSEGWAGGHRRWARTGGYRGGGITAAGLTEVQLRGSVRTIDRIAAYVADPFRTPPVAQALQVLDAACATGYDELLREQRSDMAARWDGAEVAVLGDDELTLAVRYAVFHLLTSVADAGEAAVGARGLSGDAYGGHVLWDADVYVLPALAAILPAAARAMLEYRIQRVHAARRGAHELGYRGARFPWESGREGGDVTPHLVRRSGQIVPILTGQHEEHISADIAWSACEYASWTGDTAFVEGRGRPLVVDTARYWASRARLDAAGRGHLYGVVGPDEYHEVVDDNAYTNVMARWNLRRGADLLAAGGGPDEQQEADGWRRLADALVDGYDETSGCYEEFAGFFSLEPFVVAEHFPVPAMADELLGRRRVRQVQVVKQADVLMLHHVVPQELRPGSLQADLDFYGPRTAHGSSLSPPVHACVLARAGRAEEALELFRLACRLDLDDRTGTTPRGLHTATAGGVWQAFVWGFAGIRPAGDLLTINPHLPAGWQGMVVTVRFRGARLRFTIDHERISVEADADTTLRLPDGTTVTASPPGSSYPYREHRD
jgi:trehalose/maltose hydrolase-like predicted phosphorylase